MNKYTTTTGAEIPAAHNVLYKVRNTYTGKFFGDSEKYPSIFDNSFEIDDDGFFVTERYAKILTKDQVTELYKQYNPDYLATIQLNGFGLVLLQDKVSGRYYSNEQDAFTEHKDDATVITIPSPEYSRIRRYYDLTQVWHIVVPEAPSTNATWDRFLSDFSNLYPADPEDLATDEELAHAGVRLRR
jgi:hypothetical protein